MFNFEKLDVWHKSIDFADFIYGITRKFPDYERFGMTLQMRRAAVSISSNIAEGSAKTSKTDHCRFIEMASGSVFEVVCQSHIAKRQEFMTQPQFTRIYCDAEELSRMLSGLRRALREGDVRR